MCCKLPTPFLSPHLGFLANKFINKMSPPEISPLFAHSQGFALTVFPNSWKKPKKMTACRNEIARGRMP